MPKLKSKSEARAAKSLQRNMQEDARTPFIPNSSTQQVFNRRGTPVRIRKKNRLFYDDGLINYPHRRIRKNSRSVDNEQPPKKTIRQSSVKRKTTISNTSQSTNLSSRAILVPLIKREKGLDKPNKQLITDHKIEPKISMRLQNLLKQPKAQKWICYEWFYSNIDKVLFEGDNDFTICLRESFPQLKTCKLTRTQWCMIRRMLGQPRRCSQSFFEMERRELEKKRQQIRMLQQGKEADISSFYELSKIPLQLVVGTKVTARLRKPENGLFTGSIDAININNNTYKIKFDKVGLGTYSVPDYEVSSSNQKLSA